MTVRSFRVCFAVERRIHKIDRWRIPLPFGVPLRGVAYAIAALIAVLVAHALPLIGDVLRVLPVPLRLVFLPIGVAWAMLRLELDGRSAHAAGLAYLRAAAGPKRLVAFRPAGPASTEVRLADITIAPDDRAATMRPAVVHGPADVLLRYPFSAQPRGRTVVLRQEPGPARWRGKQLRLADGQRAVIR